MEYATGSNAYLNRKVKVPRRANCRPTHGNGKLFKSIGPSLGVGGQDIIGVLDS